MSNAHMPVNPIVDSQGKTRTNMAKEEYKGLTKREHFAGLALQGLLANSEIKSWSDSQYYDQMSKQAVNHADALLKELAK